MSDALAATSTRGTFLNRDPNSPSAADESGAHSRLVRYLEEFAFATREERELASRDRDYVDHKQWTADEIRVLEARRQPPLTINRIIRKVEYLRGFERRLRSDPKAFPRTPVDEPNSDAATQALRFVADDNGFDRIRSAVWDNLLVEGVGGVDLPAEQGLEGIDVRAYQVPYKRLWWDAHSARGNFSDARYIGQMTWMDEDDAADLFPGREDAISDTLMAEDRWGTFADRPRTMMWADTRRKRVLVAQCHYKMHGDWWVASYTRTGFLSDPVKSPYIDRRGRTAPSLRMCSAYIDQDNHRYGLVRQYISMQDELNKRRSKALHLLNTRQVKAEQGAVADEAKAQREFAKPDGWITVNKGFELDVLPTGDMASGQFELLRHVSEEIDATGPNAAMAGKDPREQSGRAIQAQQQGGAVENEGLIDTLRTWDRECYQDMWMRIRQFWDGERWIRVTDDDSNTKWVGLNRQITVADELAEMDPDRRAMVMQQMAFQPGDPRLQQVIRTQNDISDLDVDITVEDGPDIATLQSEQFNFLQGRQDVPLELLIKYSALPKKGDMLKDLQAHQAQQAQAAAQAQAHALAMEQAKIGLIQAQTSLASAGAAEKNAGAADRVHGIAMDHAYVTAPDNAPPGHEMALANVVGSQVPTVPPPIQGPQQPPDATGAPSNAPLPTPDLSMIPQRPPLAP